MLGFTRHEWRCFIEGAKDGSPACPGKQSAGAATGVKRQDGQATSVDGGAWLIRCTGIEGAWGRCEPKDRYLAGFDPDVVDPNRGMAGPVQLVPQQG